MALIDSSTSSRTPLAALAGEEPPADELDETQAEAAPLPDHRDETDEEWLASLIDHQNIAELLDLQTRARFGALVVEEYRIDENSRADWKEDAEQAQKLAMQRTQPKQYPFPGASNVIFPLITTAAIQFAARTYPAIIKNRNVVKGIVWGSDRGTPMTDDGTPSGQPRTNPDGSPAWLIAPGEKRARAERIGEHMSYQLLDEMPEWEPQTDALLHQLPVIGGAIRKTYRDPALKRNFSLFVSLMDVVWNYYAPSFEAAPRHTELLRFYPHEIRELELAGMFLPIPYGPPGGIEGKNAEGAQPNDSSAPHDFLEQHRRLDLDGDGYPEPYIVTVHHRSAMIVRIVARFDEDSIEADEEGKILRVKPVDQYTLIPFMPSMDGSSYPMGFGHLLRSLSEAINTTLNQMFDAGHLQNAGGGFVSDQLGIKSGEVGFRVGRYVRVTTKGQDIRASVFPMPFPGPSQVLFTLLGTLVSAAKEVANTQDILSGDAAMANTPPTTMLALVEQGLKVYTAIHKRVFRALKQEFDKLYALNRKYIAEKQTFRVGDAELEIKPEDYRMGGGVEPIADPTMVTNMQKLTRAALIAQFKDDPSLNKMEIYGRLFEAAEMEHIDRLFAQPNPQAAMLAQLALQKEQAELGRTRAAEQKDTTQAYLNLAMAQKTAGEKEQNWIGHMMEILRMRIESVNTMVKAADVEAKSRGAVNTSEERNAARENARQAGGAGAARGTTPLAQTGPIPGVEAPPDYGRLSEISGGPEPGVPAGGNGEVPSGQSAAPTI